ncbi:unnamed protein product [Orchesella dallaii]|uniref:G-protein coupled receptors family 1 profile domain-containing protein n=1 Tax=Orchesella dallaii TaxID=48710 RepID=A0ABP1Q2M8_9HEXA
MKLHKIFYECLFTFQLFFSYSGALGSDYFYGVEGGYSEIGGEEIGDGVGIDSFVPIELNVEQNHKQTFTSTRILEIPVIRDESQSRPTSTSSNIGRGLDNDSSSFYEDGGDGNAFPTVIYTEEKFNSKLSPVGDYVFGSLLIAIGLFSFVGNGCILFVFCFRRRRLSPAEVFLVNLGIVDILLSVASYPLTMISSFKHRWDFGELGNQITCWTSCKMIGWGYLFALVWALPPLIGFGSYGLEPYGLSCTLDWIAQDIASRIYMILVTIFCVFLPLLIILFCYCRIILLVKQSDAIVRSNGVSKRNMRGSDLQLTWISGLVSLGFIIGWGPYTLVSLWSSFGGNVILPIWATPIPVLLAKSSIAYNPLIYIFFTARYREDLSSLCTWYGKFSQGKPTRNGIQFRNSKRTQDPNRNNDGDESPCNSGSSSLVTRQFTNTSGTNSNYNNNNYTPNHDNYQRPSDEEHEQARVSPSVSNGYDYDYEGGNVITNIVVNAMDQHQHQLEGQCQQELSIVVVRDLSASSHKVTNRNSMKRFIPFTNNVMEEQV